jgi:PAS domain S-box-containing protein
VNPSIGLRWSRPDSPALPAMLLPASVACLFFYLDLRDPDAMVFGLPHMLVVVLAHLLGGAGAALAASVSVGMLVAAAPLLNAAPTRLDPAWLVVAGRGLVLFSVAMVVQLLRMKDAASSALRVHSDSFEDEISRRTAEMRRINAQLHREIAERRRAENRSRYLVSIVESSDDAIIGQSLDGTIVTWNEGASRVYGHDKASMLGQPASVLLPVEQQEEMASILARVAGGDRVETLESVRRRSDGTLFDVSVSVSPIFDETGTIVGSSLIERDITRRKQAEEALQSLNVELEERVRERTGELQVAIGELETFSYSVSHDLRAPLRALRGYSDTLVGECGERLSGEERGMLARIGAAAERMDRIIDDLLLLSRSGDDHVEREVVDLGALARSVAEDLAAAEPERRVSWDIGEGLLAWGDPGLLRLLVQNLLGNAFKYTSTRETAHIAIGVETRGADGVTYFVRDDGVGFDPSMTDKVFLPFQRLHPHGEFEGSGIGLATVERIVRGHGGSVWAEGAVGQGAVMRFRLPTPDHGRRNGA